MFASAFCSGLILKEMSGRAKRYRKRKAQDSDESESEVTQGILDRLQDTRLLQKKRQRRVGLDAETLAAGERARKSDLGLGEDGEGYDEDDGPDILDAYVKEKSLKTTGESEQMNRYVELQMAKRHGKGKGDTGEKDPRTEAEIQEEELYRVPDSLHAGGTPNVSIPGLMTGITEVQLPIDVRLKNIEDTEAAKKLLLETTGVERPKEKPADEEDLPIGFQDTFEVKRSMFAPVFGRHIVKENGPSDDAVAKKFIEKEKSRWRRKK